ncbi:MAG: protein translocase subunit SecF [Kofleriaceae bacterium]
MSEHKFRYLLPPGSDFQFVAKFRIWITISIVSIIACVSILFINKAVRGTYMNWTTDFKGGTEITYTFKTKGTGSFTSVDPAAVRQALKDSGENGFDVSDITFTNDQGATVKGMIVRTPRFSAVQDKQIEAAQQGLSAAFQDRELLKVSSSGERFFVRSKKAITNAEAAPVFQAAGLELKPWDEQEAKLYSHGDEGTGEFNLAFSIWGIDRQIELALEKGLKDIDVKPEQSYAVGPKAGDKLRDDAAKSLVYAIFLIMLYLAFRFDIRYAPGAAFATIHDAMMVVGVFALTWQEVSLVSVAALLTVIGYSVNDTVIIFDRIRENQAKYKDKKLEKVIDISLNETLVRSILTSLTVFATTLIMNIFGDGLVRNFAFAMNIGVIVGTYSSIFLASPIFLWVSKTWYSGPPRTRRVAAMAAPSASTASAE